MLAVIFCLVGVALILGLGEYLGKHKLLKAESERKFVHICVGTFVAFWPWLISWQSIQLIGLAMLAIIILGRIYEPKFWRYNKSVKRETYGDIFFALAIIVCAVATQEKIFFALAMLNLSLADGLAAIIGQNFGKHWRYKVYHHDKTIIGSMAFWFISTCIFGTGLLFAHNLIDFSHYVILVIFLPPVLTILENVSIMGLDDFVIPVAAILALSAAQIK